MSLTIELDIATNAQCSSCGVIMLMTKTFQTKRKSDHGAFYCLNGHSQWYPGESEEERLRKALHASELLAIRRAAELTTALAVKAKADAALAKNAARSKAGVCPCCSRTFKQLAAHMKNKHPC